MAVVSDDGSVFGETVFTLGLKATPLPPTRMSAAPPFLKFVPCVWSRPYPVEVVDSTATCQLGTSLQVNTRRDRASSIQMRVEPIFFLSDCPSTQAMLVRE